MAERRDISERYRITRKLGESATTSVHAATDATNGAMVVIKRIAPGRTAESMPRFLQAAAALAKLRHPTIPSLLDFGTLPDGGAFLLLEPVAGRGLALLDLGQAVQAQAAFETALSMNRSYGPAIMGLAEAFRTQGKKAQAVEWYRRYLEVMPEGSEAVVARNNIERLKE